MKETLSYITECADRVMRGGEITREEALRLIRTENRATLFLLAMADQVRQKFCGDRVDFCADVNAKSGRCTENCRFCAQSGWYHTGVDEYPLREEVDLLEQAKKAEEYGAVRFGIVTSGRDQHDAEQFRKIAETVRRIHEETHLNICCSLGLLTAEQLHTLKEAGATRIHCNLETSQKHFPDICTTHTYEEKADHIRRIQEAGLDVCSGGIIGIGETDEDRVDMAFALKEKQIDSVPLNIFTPIPGTPFAGGDPPGPMEICRIFAVFRLVLPHAMIRVCAGRESALRDMQAFALASGLNGAMIGGYLTVAGRPPDRDRQMAADLGRTYSVK